ncbi:MAG: PHB depolymerase family esterase [Myxococcota bacterium]|nr:PHB depolymerase family esterase [Myxococcota bacterium]
MKPCNQTFKYNAHAIIIAVMVSTCMGCASKNALINYDLSSAGTFVQTLSHDGEEREFIVCVPSSYDGSTELPVMFNFHGFGGTAQDHMYWTGMCDVAERENFIAVHPQGSLLGGSPHWNSALPSADNKSSADDFGFVEAMIDEISATYRVDSDRVYASGYSNGSFFSYALACYRSDLIAAVGSVSGTMAGIMGDCRPSHPTAMINLHGTNDGVVPYYGSSEYSSVDAVMEYWIDYNGTDTTPQINTYNDGGTTIEHYAYTGGEGNTAVEHYRINGGDHVWFELDYQGASTSELIWNFVSQYDKNGLIESAE